MKRFTAIARTTALLAAVALVGTVSACSSTGGSDAATSSKKDAAAPIEVWARSNPEAAATYKTILAAFTKKTGIAVNYQPVLEFDTQLQARASQKDLPDVLINDGGAMGTYVSQGFLLPIDRMGIKGQGDISENAWKQNIGLDGKYYGVPWSRQAMATVIRKDWREKLGLPVPKTWADLAAMSHAFATQDPDGNGKKDTYGMVVPGTSKNGYIGWWASSYIWQAGGELLADTGEGTYKSAINSPETKTAVKWIRDQFCTPGNVVPGSLNLTTANATFFPEGTAGIYLTGPYNWKPFDTAVGKKNIEVIPMPVGPKGTTTLA